VLIRLLEIGERNGLLQCWLDAGPVSKALLVRIARCLPDRNSSRLNPLEPYLRTILTHQAKSATGRKKRSWQSTSLSCERLSAKERAVLGLVAKGRSNKHIARTLQVTTETVKTHLKRAFIKLGARTRAEAVSRAGDFGQLFEIAVLAMPAKEARHPLG
jgi:ATP/maltotriose-dependent transcriptional regulator MalT